VIDVQAIRGQFPALARRIGEHPVVHLDGPAGSQVPKSVAHAVADALVHHNGNTHGHFATSREAEAIEADARHCAVDLFGAGDPDCVVFGPNATTLLFALSRAIGRTLGGDDEIVVTQLDHDANVAPWMIAAREAGAGLKVARIRPEDGELDLDDLAAAVTPRTRVVAVTAASNAIGALPPVARIAELAHAYGALLVVDAVHYAPHRLMDVMAWGCDLAVCSPYKFFGPHAGVLWGKRQTLESLPAYRVRPVGDALPYRWMPGTPSFEAMAGTAAAIRYIASLSGVTGAQGRAALTAAYRSIAAHDQALCRQLLLGLERLPVKVFGPADPDRVAERAPTVAFTHATRSPAEVAAYLGERGVFVWHGNYYALELSTALGCEPDGMVRVGMLHYNTDGEIDRLLSLLAELGA
jgi:cysteine desulfurase family protein (TIGR01976 family)